MKWSPFTDGDENRPRGWVTAEPVVMVENRGGTWDSLGHMLLDLVINTVAHLQHCHGIDY